MLRIHSILVFALLLGCTGFPELDGAISEQARRSDYPALDPVDDLLARADDPDSDESAAAIEDLRDRARLLRARARILRRTEVVDSDAQARMTSAFERLARP